MPFSNNTSRQRWENGQVVPEYRTIMIYISSINPKGQRAINPSDGFQTVCSRRRPHVGQDVPI
jgi:hypothetical protein